MTRSGPGPASAGPRNRWSRRTSGHSYPVRATPSGFDAGYSAGNRSVHLGPSTPVSPADGTVSSITTIVDTNGSNQYPRPRSAKSGPISKPDDGRERIAGTDGPRARAEDVSRRLRGSKWGEVTIAVRTVNVGRKHQWRGSRTEAKVTSELIDRGIGVSVPVFGALRYDIVIDIDGSVERVQVKTAYEHATHEEVIVVEFVSMVYGSDGTPQRSFYTEDEIDSYIVYCPKRDVVLYVPFEETPKTAMNFSFRDPSDYNSGNRKTVNFAADYCLDARL